ncbi:MAG TPA: tetratricopeptide repeat protein [Pyrinomonadaceae bacterium]
MKRCPECRRDYTDETLNYCLDDGNALVGGPASMDERATAILHSTAQPGDPATHAQIHATDQSSVMPQPSDLVAKQPALFSARLVIPALLVLLVVIGGVVGYKYFPFASGQINSIAVMPFVNAGGGTELEYLSDGIPESLMNHLSQLSGLSVKARSSVFRYKGKDVAPEQVASDLQVQAVLNGRVTQRGEDLVISLELVDGRSGNMIWGEQYSRRFGDLAALQSEIARDVSQKLRARLTGAEENRVVKNQTQNAEAYQLYLQGRYNWNKRTEPTTQKAIEYFQRAVEKDPGYAMAYVGLAESYVLSELPAEERYGKVKTAALKALEIDPTLGEPHAALGSYYDTYVRDFPAAEREFRKAIELNPNYATAYHWMAEMFVQAIDRPDESLALYRKALELEPYSLAIGTDYAMALYYTRRYDEAIAELKKLIELDPNFVRSYQYLEQVYYAKGSYEEAVAAAEKRAALQGEKPEEIARVKKDLLDAYRTKGPQGYWTSLLKLVKEDEARGRKIWPVDYASIYARLDQRDEAFKWLNRALETGDTNIFGLKVSAEWDNLRDDPRFREFLRRAKYPL